MKKTVILTETELINLIKKVLSESVSDKESRAQKAYQYMIDGASGPGTNPNLIRQGIDFIKDNQEFYRLDTLFSDKKTGYSSFAEMINGEFEYGRGPSSNSEDFDYITNKLYTLGVKYIISYSGILNWPTLKITTKKISKPLTNLPGNEPEVPLKGVYEPSNVKINQSCINSIGDKYNEAKNWIITWINNITTKRKFKTNYESQSKFFSYDEINQLFGIYNKIIKSAPLYYYNNKMKTIDGVDLNKKRNAFMFAYNGSVYANCDNKSDNPTQVLIHELQHLLYDYFPINPYSTVSKVFRADNSYSRNKSNQDENLINSSKSLNVEPEILKYFLDVESENDPGYVCRPNEKLSNLYAIRKLFGIKPNQYITKEMLLPYLKFEKFDTDVDWLLGCWAKNGFKNLDVFLMELNQLAKNTPQNQTPDQMTNQDKEGYV